MTSSSQVTPSAPKGSRITPRSYLGGIILALLGTVGLLMFARSSASAQTAPPVVHEVEVGRLIEGVPAESMAFYPSSLKVRSGDVIHYSNKLGDIPETGVHGVLALPADEEPAQWEQENAQNLDGEWAFFQTDEDDDPGAAPSAVKGNWKTILPTDLSCGSADNPCVTGTSPASRSPLNSGLGAPLGDGYHLKIEAEPGTRVWLICPIHNNMRMKIDVVAADEATTTPEEIQQQNEAKFLRETEKAKRLHRTFSERRTSVLRSDGTRVWDAWAGVERGTVGLFKMYPETLSIKEDDSVRWHFEQIKFESHSVSFPLSEALAVHNGPWATLMCDGDTDQGPAPDFEPPGGLCPAPPSDVWEFDLHPRFYFQEGNGSLKGDEYESSGLRGPLVGMSHEPYTMKFPQSSGSVVWDYACQLHPTMRGAIKVR